MRGRKILAGVRKFYLNDLGFKNYLLGITPKDLGYNLENHIFLSLIQHDYKVYIGTEGDKEIDFIAVKGDEKKYFQVTYQLTDENVIQREFGNLLKIKDQYPKYVISLDEVKFSDYQGIKHIRPWELTEILKP